MEDKNPYLIAAVALILLVIAYVVWVKPSQAQAQQALPAGSQAPPDQIDAHVAGQITTTHSANTVSQTIASLSARPAPAATTAAPGTTPTKTPAPKAVPGTSYATVQISTLPAGWDIQNSVYANTSKSSAAPTVALLVNYNTLHKQPANAKVTWDGLIPPAPTSISDGVLFFKAINNTFTIRRIADQKIICSGGWDVIAGATNANVMYKLYVNDTEIPLFISNKLPKLVTDLQIADHNIAMVKTAPRAGSGKANTTPNTNSANPFTHK